MNISTIDSDPGRCLSCGYRMQETISENPRISTIRWVCSCGIYRATGIRDELHCRDKVVQSQFFKDKIFTIVWADFTSRIDIYWTDNDFLTLLTRVDSTLPFTKSWLDDALIKYKKLLIFT